MPKTAEEMPYARPKQSFWQRLPYRVNGRLQWLLKLELNMRIFGPNWAPLFGPAYAGQWKIALHLKFLRHYLAQAAFHIADEQLLGKRVKWAIARPLEQVQSLSAWYL